MSGCQKGQHFILIWFLSVSVNEVSNFPANPWKFNFDEDSSFVGEVSVKNFSRKIPHYLLYERMLKSIKRQEKRKIREVTSADQSEWKSFLNL